MNKIGEFIYPWGNGHYSRMMRLNQELEKELKEEYEIHMVSKDPIYKKLLEQFPSKKKQIHQVLMPTPIDGKFGPSISLSLMNILFSIQDNPPLVRQIKNYLLEERRLYDNQKFDLVVNDGDMGSNILAKNRGITSLFVTNQFKPKLWKSRSYFYPALVFVTKQMEKAKKIIVADSPPPYTICEYNLNFSDDVKRKVTYVGHFSDDREIDTFSRTSLEKLIDGQEFGYWMRTGNKSTNDGTGERYEEVFCDQAMVKEKRIISHAKNDKKIDCVLGSNGKKYSIEDALEKKIDWVQIDIGFLSEQEIQTVQNSCKYAVINGSHTVMGELLGKRKKPIIGMPIYDEHSNQLQWAQENQLGILAEDTKHVLEGIKDIRNNYERYLEKIDDFSENFISNGAQNTSQIISGIIEDKK